MYRQDIISHPFTQDGDLVRLLRGGELQGGLAPCEQCIKELRCCKRGDELQPCKDLAVAQICRCFPTVLLKVVTNL